MADDNQSSLSIAEATRLMTQQPNGPRNPPEEDTPEPDEDEREPPPEEEDDDLTEGLTEEDEDTPEEAPDEEPEEPKEPEYSKGRFAADDARTRLDDGTTITIAELKRGTLLQADYSKKTMALAEERKSYEQHKAEVAEVEKTLAQQRETLAMIAQAYLPKPPDPAMLDPQSGVFDMVSYTMQKDAYDRQSQLVHQMINDHRSMLERQTAEQDRELKALRDREGEMLFEKLPHLKSEDAYAKFWNKAVAYTGEIGFTPEELNAVNDHRTYLVLADAIAYRDLKAKVKAAKVKIAGKPGLLPGSSRRSPEVVQAQNEKAAMARLEKTGSYRDGVAAYLARNRNPQ